MMIIAVGPVLLPQCTRIVMSLLLTLTFVSIFVLCCGICFLIVVDVVYEKMKIFKFFERAQKRSKLTENDIDVYLRLFRKYGAKLPSQKISYEGPKSMRWEFCW
jgi:hypothetical protein